MLRGRQRSRGGLLGVAANVLALLDRMGAAIFDRSSAAITTTGPFNVLAAIGDSITNGDDPSQGYLTFVSAALGASPVTKFAYNGNSWVYDWPTDPHVGTLTDDAPTVWATIAAQPYVARKMHAFAGTNGIVLKGNNGDQEYADFITWLTATLAQGWQANDIVVATMLPRQSMADVNRLTFNRLLVYASHTYGFRLARYDLQSWAFAGASSNTTNYPDGTHPSLALRQLMGPISAAAFTAAIDTVYGGELIPNGGFSSAAGWSMNTGWTISGGIASSDGTGQGANLYFNDAFVAVGKKYRVRFDLTVTTGTIYVRLGGLALAAPIGTSGSYDFTVTATATGQLLFSAWFGAAPVGTVANVSCKEVF